MIRLFPRLLACALALMSCHGHAELLVTGRFPAVGASSHAWFLLSSETNDGMWDLCHAGYRGETGQYRAVRRLGKPPVAMAAFDSTLWLVFEEEKGGVDRFDVYRLRAEFQSSLDLHVMQPRDGFSILPPLRDIRSLLCFAGTPNGPVAIGTSPDGALLGTRFINGQWSELSLPSGLPTADPILAAGSDAGLLLLAQVPGGKGTSTWHRAIDGTWQHHVLPLSGLPGPLIMVDGQPLLVSMKSPQDLELVYVPGAMPIPLATLEVPAAEWTAIGTRGAIVLVEEIDRIVETRLIDAVTGEELQVGLIEPAGFMSTGVWSIALAVGLASMIIMVVVLARGGDLSTGGLPEGYVPLRPLARLVALCIDLVPGLVVYFSFCDGSWRQLVRVPMMNLSSEDVVPYVSLVGVTVAWCFLTEAAWLRTPGKWLMGARVIATSRERCSRGQVLVRNLVKGLILLVPPLAVLALLHPNQQGLGDLLSRTAVVRRSPQSGH